MNGTDYRNNRLWSLILAGGDGERLKAHIRQWLGRHIPKQYCTFMGTRSMFQHTIDRSDRIIPPERRVTVIAQKHLEEVNAQLNLRSRGKLILQPANRDTAAGIFLGLAEVRARDPEATVLIFPSDHFVYPEKRFIDIAFNMAGVAGSMKQWVFLLGATPDKPEQEYGWIQPGAHLALLDGCRIRLARQFLEKPDPAGCVKALKAGALWNTMVMAAKVDTLWNLGKACFPEIISLFEAYGESVGTDRELQILEDIYHEMPKRNFSTHLLQECPRHVIVMELKDVLWSDWGNPARIEATLRQFGCEPELCWENLAALAG